MTKRIGKPLGRRWTPALLLLLILAIPEVMQAAGPYQFFAVTPCRIVDTRGPTGPTGGPALTNGQPRNLPINVAPANCGIPATAKAVALNVTMVAPTQDGFIKIWPYSTPSPTVSTINAVAGEPAIANGAIVPLTTNPSFNITVSYGTAAPGTCNLITDVVGYFQ
jgi:hypothetical protein